MERLRKSYNRLKPFCLITKQQVLQKQKKNYEMIEKDYNILIYIKNVFSKNEIKKNSEKK